MIKFNISYEDLMKAHKEFQLSKYDKVYEELIIPNKDVWVDLNSIIDFVRRWTPRVSIGKNEDKIKEVVFSLKEKFLILNNYNLEDFEFTLENIKLIRNIFDELSKTVLKFTATTKLMHGINPNLFVMWDNGIYQKYGCYNNSAGYIRFMESMQEIVLEILKQYRKEDIIKETNRTLPKLIDEYNWINYRTSKYKNSK